MKKIENIGEIKDGQEVYIKVKYKKGKDVVHGHLFLLNNKYEHLNLHCTEKLQVYNTLPESKLDIYIEYNEQSNNIQ